MYYLLYIRHNFVFFSLETMRIIPFPNFLYEYKLDHHWFPERYKKINFLKLL
jgi:hypothetical protein